MTIDMTQFYQVFFDETAEHLAEMETLLLALDPAAPDLEDLNAVFRAAHSIKGGSGTFGFNDMTELTHELESLLDRLRRQEAALAPAMIDAFLAAGDALREQLDAHRDGRIADAARAHEVQERLRALAGAGPTPVAAVAPPSVRRAQVSFFLDDPRQDMAAAIAGLADLLGPVDLPAHSEDGAGLWRFGVTTGASESEIRETLAFLADPQRITVEFPEGDPGRGGADAAPADPGYGFFEAIEPSKAAAPDPGYGFFEPIEPATGAAPSDPGYGFFEPLADTAAPAAPAPALRAAESDAHGGRRPSDRAAGDAGSIRVGVEKVDQLINLVGELVITQAMLAQMAGGLDPVAHEALLEGLGQLERNTRDLQEAVMSTRMMPIAVVFSRFPRVVRDLASKLDKEVELRTIGENTELDKGLVEKLADPLNHLIRNSLDHGIESPEERERAGKPPKGTITLCAYHQGGNVVIEVGDDGAGLDREKILAKARERGLPVQDSMPDQDVWQLIFEAGFSTAEAVTDVSGRGVGMDVVRRNIQALSGRVEIDSQPGGGTRMVIRLPLTLAILDGMSVRLGDETFILPLNSVVESLQPGAADIKTVSGQGRVVQVRGEYLPVVALADAFGKPRAAGEPNEGILIIIEAEGTKAALLVDGLVGQHQVVIKSLETNYRKVAGISGATIMGDGRVALILDLAYLARQSRPRPLLAA